jgi:hypothetical protein
MRDTSSPRAGASCIIFPRDGEAAQIPLKSSLPNNLKFTKYQQLSSNRENKY